MTTALCKGVCVSLVLAAWLPPAACAAPPVYYAKPTYGTVVDAETQQPISAAVVIATWVLYLPGGDRVKNLVVREVVTNEDGGFRIPGWGPKVRPGFAELTHDDPAMIIFKSGYEPMYLTNKVTSHPSQASVRVSEWNGKTIAPKPFQGTPNERVSQLEFMVGDCERLGVPVPRLYAELAKEKDVLGSMGELLFIRAKHLRGTGE